MIRADIVQNLYHNLCVENRPTFLLADGRPVKSLGCLSLSVRCGLKEVDLHRVAVASDLPCSLILGRDWLSASKATIDFTSEVGILIMSSNVHVAKSSVVTDVRVVRTPSVERFMKEDDRCKGNEDADSIRLGVEAETTVTSSTQTDIGDEVVCIASATTEESQGGENSMADQVERILPIQSGPFETTPVVSPVSFQRIDKILVFPPFQRKSIRRKFRSFVMYPSPRVIDSYAGFSKGTSSSDGWQRKSDVDAELNGYGKRSRLSATTELILMKPPRFSAQFHST